MGKGLSDLQKLILHESYQSHVRLSRVPNPPEWDFKQENLIGGECFGFPVNKNAQKAAISRAVSRLVKRGLMVNLGEGFIRLTDKGMGAGEKLYRLTLDERRQYRKRRLTIIKEPKGGELH